jgi:hypothetical protein
VSTAEHTVNLQAAAAQAQAQAVEQAVQAPPQQRKASPRKGPRTPSEIKPLLACQRQVLHAHIRYYVDCQERSSVL